MNNHKYDNVEHIQPEDPKPCVEDIIAEIIRFRQALPRDPFDLNLVQQPVEGRAAGKTEKARGTKWPIDPPPVIEFVVKDNDKSRAYLQSPFWFCTAELEPVASHRSGTPSQASLLSGCLVSSLHKVKLADNKEHGLFIFGDLNAKIAGTFRLLFTLYEMRQGEKGWHAATLNQLRSNEFRVMTSKEHAAVSPRESTSLSRTLSEAGVKLRIRKETSKRKAQASDWAADKRQAISALGLPSGSMPPPMMRWNNMPSPHGMNIPGRLNYDKPPPPFGGHAISDRSTNHQDMRPPPLSSTYLPHDRSRGVATNSPHLPSNDGNYNGCPSHERQSQRPHLTSPFESSSPYEQPRGNGSSESQYSSRNSEHMSLQANGYVTPQNNYPSYGGGQRAEQYNRDQRVNGGSTDENGQGGYRDLHNDYAHRNGQPSPGTEMPYSASHYGQNGHSSTTNLTYHGDMENDPRRPEPLRYQSELSGPQSRVNYAPTEPYSYSR